MEISNEFAVDLRNLFKNLLISSTISSSDKEFCIYSIAMISSKIGMDEFQIYGKKEVFPGIYIESSDLSEIKNFLRNKQKISAIKLFRTLTGAGLKESKDYCDRLELSCNITDDVVYEDSAKKPEF